MPVHKKLLQGAWQQHCITIANGLTSKRDVNPAARARQHQQSSSSNDGQQQWVCRDLWQPAQPKMPSRQRILGIVKATQIARPWGPTVLKAMQKPSSTHTAVFHVMSEARLRISSKSTCGWYLSPPCTD